MILSDSIKQSIGVRSAGSQVLSHCQCNCLDAAAGTSIMTSAFPEFQRLPYSFACRVIAVGISVDYSGHVARAFMIAQGTRQVWPKLA